MTSVPAKAIFRARWNGQYASAKILFKKNIGKYSCHQRGMGGHQRVPTSAKIGQRLTLASWVHFRIFWKCIVFEKKSCWTWAERIRFWARFQTNGEMSRLGSRENLRIQDRIVRRCFNETWNCGRRWPQTPWIEAVSCFSFFEWVLYSQNEQN